MTAEDIASEIDAALPKWATATVVIRDAAGDLIGHGLLARTPGGVELTVTAASCPSDWTALSEAHEAAGG